MVRITDILLISAVVAGAVWTYEIKHQSEQSAKTLANLRTQLNSQNTKIGLLEADWAIMTNPTRLERIARDFSEQLLLRPMESSQIILLDELPPLRQVEEDLQTPTASNSEIDTESITGGIGALVRAHRKERE